MVFFTRLECNAVLRAVSESRAELSAFEFFNGQDRAQVKHQSTDSEFNINGRSGNYYFQRKVGNEWIRPIMAPTLNAICVAIIGWANDIVSLAEFPDVWQEIPGPIAMPGEFISDSGNTAFTSNEQAAISTQLKAIAETVKKTYELTTEQSAEIDKKFKEADKASRRMGRKDWGLLFGGALLSLILSDAITPGIMGHILVMVQHGIGQLFMGPPTGGGILSTGQD